MRLITIHVHWRRIPTNDKLEMSSSTRVKAIRELVATAGAATSPGKLSMISFFPQWSASCELKRCPTFELSALTAEP